MNGERTALFDCLYRRMGELTAHLGRYDMQFVALASMLTDEVVLRDLIASWPIDGRADVIARLLHARNLPAHFRVSFIDIHHQMKPVLERQMLSPTHPAVATQIGFVRPWESTARTAASPDWFNRTEVVSKDEIGHMIGSVERDILTAVKLYLSLATLSSRVERALRDLRQPPAPMMAS